MSGGGGGHAPREVGSIGRGLAAGTGDLLESLQREGTQQGRVWSETQKTEERAPETYRGDRVQTLLTWTGCGSWYLF